MSEGGPTDPATHPTEPDATQAAIVRFLEDPTTHGVDHVERIDTHISHVFIAGPTTYKLKRPVARSFVDYSTVQKRRAMCEREVDINSAYAPRIYKGVRAIVATDAGYALDGPGEPVDYVVEMATFNPDMALDRVAERAPLDASLVRELADEIAALHCRADVRREGGGRAGLAGVIEGLGRAIRNTPPASALEPELVTWETYAQETLSAQAGRLEARRRHGYVRRCHGDLHLANICLFEGRPTLFDAIEFNEDIATVDVLYDIGFTLMDLLYRGQRAAANRLICRYVNLTRDGSGLRLLPLFVSARAAVRAMVAASKPGNTAIAAKEARRRLVFAAEALQAPKGPWLIAIGGFSGSGKSTVAAGLAPQLTGLHGALVLRSDVYRKRLFDVSPEEQLPESAYSDAVSQRVYAKLLKDAGRILRAGVPVILDATFTDPDAGAPLRQLACASGAPFTGLWLDVPLEVLQRRIAARRGDASDATGEIAAKQWQSMPQPPRGFLTIDAVGAPEAIIARARAMTDFGTNGFVD